MAVKKINSLNEHQNLSTNENPFNIEDYMNANWDKIKDVVNNNADELTIAQGKLEELQNYDVTEIKKDIEELKTEQTEQNEEIDLIANMIPTLETEEAEELNVKSSKYYGNLDLKGNTWQENTETLSPGNPSKIHNVEGNVEINICNKNVANLDIKEYQHHVTTEKVATNIFKVTRTEDTSSSYGQVSMNLKTNKTYTIYVKISGTNTAGAFVGVWKGYNASGVYKSNVTNYATIQTTQELLVLGLYPNQTENLAGLETTFEIMIVEGNRINESFIAHEGQEITFPLEEGQKLYKGSYLGEEKIYHVRKQIEFDGTENWVKSTTKEYAFQYSLGGISLNGICTHYQSTGNANDIGTKDSIYLKYSYTAIITDLRFTDVEDFKEYLVQQKQAGTPVTIEYELAEEETEEMTEQQKEA